MSHCSRQTTKILRHPAPAFIVMALLLLTPAAGADVPDYTRHDFNLPPDTERFIIIDGNGNGLSDILAVADRQLTMYFQHPDEGFDFSRPGASLSLPGRSIGWDLSRSYPAPDGSSPLSVIALIDGNRVSAWQLENGTFSDERGILTGVDGFLGQGSHRMHFSRDLNRNGRDDLIIPGAGELNLHIRNSDGSYQRPLPVLSDIRISSDLHNDRIISSRVGQEVEIPLMELRDVNADGHPDLIVDTSERLGVYLANANGDEEYFPRNPSFSIDRTAIRERLGSFDIDRLDFSNLTGALALTHEEILQDVTGDGIDDVILREGGRVALHLGSTEGVDLSRPQQILRSGGNVLTTFLHDENGNGRPDLWLWRVEQISVRDLFLWLAISGSIDIEAFIYHNQGDSFARRPARRITVTLRFPSAVRMLGSVREVRDEARNMEAVIPMVRANVDHSSPQDLVVLLNDRLELFRDALEPEQEADEDRFLASLDYQRSRDNYEIDIRRMIDEFEIDINRDLRRVGDRDPDVVLPLNREQQRGDIMATDLNGNGLDDILVFLERSNEAVQGMLLLSR